MYEFTEFQFESKQLARHALPDIAYPVPEEQRASLDLEGSDIPIRELLFWLQLHSADPTARWLELEPAMARLVQLLTPADSQNTGQAEGENWCLQLAPVELGQEVVTIQRDGFLLAALSPDEEGRLVLSSFRPLDAGSLGLLLQLGARPHPRHGVAMRANNWEYALDSAANLENYHALNRSEAYLAHHRHGLQCNEADVACPSQTAAQLQVYHRALAVSA